MKDRRTLVAVVPDPMPIPRGAVAMSGNRRYPGSTDNQSAILLAGRRFQRRSKRSMAGRLRSDLVTRINDFRSGWSKPNKSASATSADKPVPTAKTTQGVTVSGSIADARLIARKIG